jgi:hypothetical protein
MAKYPTQPSGCRNAIRGTYLPDRYCTRRLDSNFGGSLDVGRRTRDLTKSPVRCMSRSFPACTQLCKRLVDCEISRRFPDLPRFQDTTLTFKIVHVQYQYTLPRSSSKPVRPRKDRANQSSPTQNLIARKIPLAPCSIRGVGVLNRYGADSGSMFMIMFITIFSTPGVSSYNPSSSPNARFLCSTRKNLRTRFDRLTITRLGETSLIRPA